MQGITHVDGDTHRDVGHDDAVVEVPPSWSTGG
jgi:hypothetical protein